MKPAAAELTMTASTTRAVTTLRDMPETLPLKPGAVKIECLVSECGKPADIAKRFAEFVPGKEKKFAPVVGNRRGRLFRLGNGPANYRP